MMETRKHGGQNRALLQKTPIILSLAAVFPWKQGNTAAKIRGKREEKGE